MDKRSALIAAGLDAFRRDGFAATRIGDIANAAKVGKGTVYEYFPSKEALLLACCLSQCEENRADILEALGDDPDLAAVIPASHESMVVPDLSTLADPLAAFRRIVETAITLLIERSTMNCRLFLELFALARHHPELQAQAQPAILQVLERWEALLLLFLQAALAKGQIRPSHDLPALCRTLSATVDGLLLQRSWRDDASPAELARRVTQTFIAGLLP